MRSNKKKSETVCKQNLHEWYTKKFIDRQTFWNEPLILNSLHDGYFLNCFVICWLFLKSIFLKIFRNVLSRVDDNKRVCVGGGLILSLNVYTFFGRRSDLKGFEDFCSPDCYTRNFSITMSLKIKFTCCIPCRAICNDFTSCFEPSDLSCLSDLIISTSFL